MRFTVIGHSCLYVETRAGSILVDPWLSGSCYWRSWWHYPPSAEPGPEVLAPDFVYLTHHHFDHFHYPSMRRLDRAAHVLIAKFGVDVMAGELRGLGFDQVTELEHGSITSLGHGVSVASYQYGFDDTTFVVRDGDHVIVNVNDCKIRGRALAQIVQDFGHPTFAFKSHSFAQSYPVAYEAEDPADLELISRQTYIDDFVETMRVLEPRYAVPFGSMVGFLHPESQGVNEHLITPGELKEGFDKANRVPGCEVVPMAPGDTWSSAGTDGGFALAEHDWYTNRPQHLADLTAQVQPKLAAQAAAEEGVTLDWGVFSAYLQGFLDALPPFTGRALLDRPIVFHVPSSDQPYWVVDGKAGRVYRSASAPEDRADVIHVSEAVLSWAIRDRVLHVVHGGMRIHTELRAGGASADLAFWGLMMIFEIGYLPKRWRLGVIPAGGWPTRRMAKVAWRRREELIGMLGALRGSGSMLERMSNTFGAEGERAEADRADGDDATGVRGRTSAA